jgi:hypothetical protein
VREVPSRVMVMESLLKFVLVCGYCTANVPPLLASIFSENSLIPIKTRLS